LPCTQAETANPSVDKFGAVCEQGFSKPPKGPKASIQAGCICEQGRLAMLFEFVVDKKVGDALVVRTEWFGADLAIIDSGSTH
jgi:hypothetical protein